MNLAIKRSILFISFAASIVTSCMTSKRSSELNDHREDSVQVQNDPARSLNAAWTARSTEYLESLKAKIDGNWSKNYAGINVGVLDQDIQQVSDMMAVLQHVLADDPNNGSKYSLSKRPEVARLLEVMGKIDELKSALIEAKNDLADLASAGENATLKNKLGRLIQADLRMASDAAAAIIGPMKIWQEAVAVAPVTPVKKQFDKLPNYELSSTAVVSTGMYSPDNNTLNNSMNSANQMCEAFLNSSRKFIDSRVQVPLSECAPGQRTKTSDDRVAISVTGNMTLDYRNMPELSPIVEWSSASSASTNMYDPNKEQIEAANRAILGYCEQSLDFMKANSTDGVMLSGGCPIPTLIKDSGDRIAASVTTKVRMAWPIEMGASVREPAQQFVQSTNMYAPPADKIAESSKIAIDACQTWAKNMVKGSTYRPVFVSCSMPLIIKDSDDRIGSSVSGKVIFVDPTQNR